MFNITGKVVQRLDRDGGQRQCTRHSMATTQKTEEPGWATVCSGENYRVLFREGVEQEMESKDQSRTSKSGLNGAKEAGSGGAASWGGAFGMRLLRVARRSWVQDLAARWVGFRAARSLDSRSGGAGRGGRGAGPPAARGFRERIPRSPAAGGGAPCLRPRSPPGWGIGLAGARTGPPKTQVSQDPVPGAVPRRLQVHRDPTRTLAALPAARGRAAAGLRELPHPSKGTRVSARRGGWRGAVNQ